MISLGQRIEISIDDLMKGSFATSLQQACIAFDTTAQRHYKGDLSAKAQYARLLDDYFWLIELMAFGAERVRDFRLHGFALEEEPKPSFLMLTDYVVARNLEDDGRFPRRFAFTDLDTIGIEKGQLALPKKLIWGLLAVCVFCPANADERMADGYWLGIFGNRFVINDFWGQEAVARIVHEKRTAALGAEGSPPETG